MIGRSSLPLVIATFVLMLCASPAYAGPTAALRIIVGPTTIEVADQGVGDFYSSVVGVVTALGAVNGWTYYTEVGLTKPVLGSSAQPELDLLYNGQHIAAGYNQMTILFSDTDFGPLPEFFSWIISFGGTNNNGLMTEINVYADAANKLFGKSDKIMGSGILTASAYDFEFSAVDIDGYGDPFSITLEAVFTDYAPPGSGGGDLQVVAVPEPSVLLLLGIGLGAVGLSALRFKK